MKERLKKNAIFIVFTIIIIILDLMLVSIQNYDNIILQKKYDLEEERNKTHALDYYEMLDNKSKIENSEEFISNTHKVILIPSIVFLILFFFIDFEKFDKDKIFLIVFIPIALIYLFIIPIGGVPDENAHWYRSYEISLGNLISDKNENNLGGRVLPSNLRSVLTYDYKGPTINEKENYISYDSYGDWKHRYNDSLSKDSGEEFIEFSNTALYPAICYFPQALGIAVARCFTNSLMIQAYFARLFNLALFVVVMWYAIKKMPFKKTAMFVIACLPIVFQEAASMSLDGTLVAFSTLLISYTLYLAYDKDKEKLNVKDYIILIISAIFTAITKVVYLPICLIIYLIPKEKFKDTKQKYIILTLIFLLATIVDLLVIIPSFGYSNDIASKEADTIAQLKNILTNPVQFCLVILATIRKYGIEHILSIFGQKSLSWLDVSISPIYIVSLIIITLYYMFCDNSENDKISIQAKIFAGLLTLFTIAAILVTEYLTITAYGYFYIIGIQGRYYIPILILLCIALSNNIIINKKQPLPIKFLLMFLVLMNLHSLTYVMFKYL